MNIAIITGGESGERDVSINSSENIAETITFCTPKTYIFPEDKEKFITEHELFDVVIPMIHGSGGEDGELQRFLVELNLPFLFSSAQTHEIAIDKIKTKKIAQKIGIPTPDNIQSENPTFPLFAKPRNSGSSLAAKFCDDLNELNDLKAQFPEMEFILEKPIKGREFTVGIIENNNVNIALPVIEIISKTGIFDYASKYDSENLAQEICPANINDELTQKLKSYALQIHEKLNVRHMSRSDFLMDTSGNIYFLEINTIPGLTKTSLIPKMIIAQGLKLESLFKNWLNEIVS